MTTIRIPALAMHSGQRAILASKARYRVVSAGRRFGKTLFCTEWLSLAEGGAIDGNPVAWFSPTYKMMLEVWAEMCSTLRPITRKANGSEMRIELTTGGTIDFWTLEAPAAGRGRKYKRIVIDEAAHSRNLEQTWQQAIAPTLTDYQGEAIFVSTPAGHNFFHTLFNTAQSSPDWQSWQLPTTTNPHIPAVEIENMRRMLPERVFQQEYMAQFIADGAGVFRGIDHAPLCQWQDFAHPGAAYVIGADWGRHNDFTVFTVMNHHGQIVHLDRFTEIGYELQAARLKSLWTRFGKCPILAESNSMGGPLIERLQADGVTVRAFNTTNASKSQAIEALSLALENGRISFADDPRLSVLRHELLAYDQERLPSGQIRYGAPPGQHDDCVMSLAIAWHGIPAQSGRVPIFASPRLAHV